jgi:hypothetical protein
MSGLLLHATPMTALGSALWFMGGVAMGAILQFALARTR